MQRCDSPSNFPSPYNSGRGKTRVCMHMLLESAFQSESRVNVTPPRITFPSQHNTNTHFTTVCSSLSFWASKPLLKSDIWIPHNNRKSVSFQRHSTFITRPLFPLRWSYFVSKSTSFASVLIWRTYKNINNERKRKSENERTNGVEKRR